MAKRHTVKTPENQSKKAHVPLPPKDLQPEGETMDGQRGETGQFTGQGAPGIGKR